MKLNKTTYKSFALAGITAAVLTACSSGGTCGTCAIPVPATGSKLIFVAPSILPSLANTTGINYMGVYNPTTTAISNISYSLGQAVGTGSSVTLDPASAKACANIAAKSSCFLKLSVPESTIAGGAVVTASNSDGTEAATPLAIGVQQVPYGESANANGVGLYFYPKAQYSESGVPFMLATAVVQSPNVGNINSIEIVDESGNLIADQYVTSGNSGVGAAPLTMGSVVEIMLPLPKGVNLSQNYKVRTSYQSAPSTLSTIAEKLGLANKQTQATSNQTTGTQVYTVTTQGNNINLQFTPSQVYLTGKNPVQYGYLYNIGDLTASQIQVSSSSPNVRVTAADQILNGQRVIKVTYELINTTVAPASNIVTVTAQNPAGQTQTSTGNTNQNVSPDVVPTPSPTPTPTPTPTPGPAPSPVANLTLSSSSISLNTINFTQTITITNAGTADATNLVLPTLNAPVYSYSSTCIAGMTLAPTASCTYTVSYAGATNASSETVNFGYTGGSSAAPLTISWVPATQWGYLVRNDLSNPGVYKCTLGAAGDLSGCIQQANSTSIGRGRDLTFNVVNGVKYLYVADYQAGGIFKCTLSAMGDINACTDITASTPASGIEAGYITFATVNNVQYVYFTDTNNHNLFTCKVKSDGDFEDCNATNFSYIYGISFATMDGIPYLYVNADINSSEGLLRFPLNTTTGQPIDNELQLLLNYSNYDSGVDIYKFNGVQYLYSGYTGPVGASWTLSADGSSVSNSINFANINNLPYSINFTTPTDMSPYGYVQSTGGIYKCNVNQNTGALTGCANTSAAMGVSVAFSLFEPCSLCGVFTTDNFSGGADLPAVAANLSLGSFTDGFQAGDAICQHYATNNSYAGTYKALIAGSNRQPSGSDWVIHANTPYVRASDGITSIGTSTAGAQLPDTLINAIAPSVMTPALNGFTYNSNPWVVDTVNGNCNNWTSATAGTWVTLGYPNQTAVYASGMIAPVAAYLVGAINNVPSTIGCNSVTSVLYCVQQ